MRRLARHLGAIATNPYPNEDDLKILEAARAALAGFGVASAESGYDLSALAAAIYARGWSYSIDRTGGDFRAIVAQSGGDHGQFQAMGIGWSMEAALAFALEKALKVDERRESAAIR